MAWLLADQIAAARVQPGKRFLEHVEQLSDSAWLALQRRVALYLGRTVSGGAGGGSARVWSAVHSRRNDSLAERRSFHSRAQSGTAVTGSKHRRWAFGKGARAVARMELCS